MMSQLKKLKESLEEKFEKYSKFLFPLIFVFGFVLDLLTLNRIDQSLDLAILITHTVLVAVWILFWQLELSAEKKWKKLEKIKKFARDFAPAAMQFSLGALFSGFVIFYTKSSSIFISWPFLIILYFLFIGNETFQKFYKGLLFQMSVFYFAVLTLLIFLVPLWLKQIGPLIFLLSGLLSLVFMRIFFGFIRRVFKSISVINYKRLWLSIGIILASVNLLYYENLIPAIPLSLKSDGIYHHIEKQGANYLAAEESQNFLKKTFFPTEIHKPADGRVYYFSAVFAPNYFTEPIVHTWQKYDSEKKYWKHVFEKPLKIIGGRDGGYRGYTYLKAPSAGEWRVIVQTPRGQILGQKTFTIIESKFRPRVHEEIL